MQSLNIPHLQPLAPDDFVRNNSQQLTTNNMDHSVVLQPSMDDVLSRTHKIFKQYESMCSIMKRQQMGMEKQLKQAKIQIKNLQKKLSLRRSRQL